MGNAVCPCLRSPNAPSTGQINHVNTAYTPDDTPKLRKLGDEQGRGRGYGRPDSDRYTVQPNEGSTRNRRQPTSSFDNEALSVSEVNVETSDEGKEIVRGLYDYQLEISAEFQDDEEHLNFFAGDLMEVIEKNGEWWMARKISDGKVGYIPSNFVVPEIQEETTLESFEWYHGNVSRKTAEQLLLDSYNDRGVFLIRESDNTPGAHALSLLDVRSETGRVVKHYRIKGSETEGYNITPQRNYDTLQKFIEGYIDDSDGLCCSLSRPCPKQRPTIYDLSKSTRDNWEISKDELEFIEVIGQGFFGEVWKGKWKGRIPVAIKKLKEGAMLPEKFLSEAVVMKNLRHNNLVNLLAVCSTEPLYIISELLRESLFQYLKNHDDLSYYDITDIAKQIAEGMEYMEKNKYIHRDLAARNILMVDDTQIKIADFGLARALIDEDSEIYCAEKGVKLPLKWTAPESVLKNEFTIKSDVWAYGIVLVELTTRGMQPYPGIRGQDIISQLQTGYRHPKPRNCPDSLYECMMKCWNEEPKLRPNFEELRQDMTVQLTTMGYEG